MSPAERLHHAALVRRLVAVAASDLRILLARLRAVPAANDQGTKTGRFPKALPSPRL